MGALDDIIDNAGKTADEEIAKMKAKTEQKAEDNKKKAEESSTS